MIQLDLSILNQNGTPMFNSDIFANRPPFGIVGRIFISTDTSQIFRDTGTSYVLIASTGSGGTITGSGTTGTLPLWSGSTSLGDSLITQSGLSLFASAKTFVNNTNTGVSLINPLGLSVGTTNTFNGGITWPALEPCDNVEFLQLNQYGGNITYGIGSYTANHLILSSFTFLVASTTITSNQTTGIRALSNQTLQARINGTNNGTITHFANSLVYGDFAASTARFNFTNRYGYLVNNFEEYGAGHTYTNRYAFYNQGANDNNYFAGKMLLNTLVVTSDQLSVVGTTNLNGALKGTSATFSGVLGVNGSSPITPYTPNFYVNGIGGGGSIIIRDNGQEMYIANSHVGYFGTTQAGSSLNFTSGEAITALTLGSTGDAKFSKSVYSGASSINASAQLQADSTTKGFLPPRMTTIEKNAIASPAAGLLIYDSTLNKLCVRTAAAWETITSV